MNNNRIAAEVGIGVIEVDTDALNLKLPSESNEQDLFSLGVLFTEAKFLLLCNSHLFKAMCTVLGLVILLRTN